MLDHLKTDGYYLFQGELIEPLHKGKRPPSLECRKANRRSRSRHTVSANFTSSKEPNCTVGVWLARFSGTLRTRATTVDAPPWYPGCGKAPVPPGAFSYGATAAQAGEMAL